MDWLHFFSSQWQLPDPGEFLSNFCIAVIYNYNLNSCQISGVEGRCRVWIGNDVMLDAAEYRPNPASFDAVEGHLYDFEIEYSLVRHSWLSLSLIHSLIFLFVPRILHVSFLRWSGRQDN